MPLNAIIKHWLRAPYHIDGWRLDVIHMLGEGKGAINNAFYVNAFRQAAKSVNEDCYILGEHFFEASQWLQGNQEDGSMNYYGFAHPVRAFFANLDISFDPCQIDASELVDWMTEAMAKVPWQNQLSQLNQLDSHDTMRFLTMINNDKQSFKNALTMLFCFVGVPCLYYGTEVCLKGRHDPDNRRTFPWSRVESEQQMLSFIQSLTQLRQHSLALKKGSIHWLYAKEKTFAFARFINDEVIICAINQSNTNLTIPLALWQIAMMDMQLQSFDSSYFVEVIQGQASIELKGKSYMILKNT